MYLIIDLYIVITGRRDDDETPKKRVVSDRRCIFFLQPGNQNRIRKRRDEIRDESDVQRSQVRHDEM